MSEAHKPPQSEFVSEVRETVQQAADAGFLCAESVLLGLAKAQKVDSGVVPGMATVLCSGMGRTCGPCGALTGALLGLGLAFGRSGPGETVDKAYAAAQQLVGEFEREFGARDCKELLGCDIRTAEGVAKFERDGLYQRCDVFVATAAKIAARIISERKK